MVASGLCQIAMTAGFNAQLNAKVTCLWNFNRGSIHNFRPADVLINENTGRHTCIDVTVVSPMCPSNARFAPGLLVADKADSKVTKHAEACEQAGLASAFSRLLLTCAVPWTPARSPSYPDLPKHMLLLRALLPPYLSPPHQHVSPTWHRGTTLFFHDCLPTWRNWCSLIGGLPNQLCLIYIVVYLLVS